MSQESIEQPTLDGFLEQTLSSVTGQNIEDFLKGRPPCPACGGRELWYRGERRYRYSGAKVWECRNEGCRLFGHVFTTNDVLRKPNQRRRISNKVPWRYHEVMWQMHYQQEMKASQIREHLIKLGIDVKERTVTNIVTRQSGEQEGSFWLNEGVKDAIGFRFGDRKFHYLIVDATPYKFREQVHYYFAMDYPSKIIIKYDETGSLGAEAVRQFLSGIATKRSYVPNVVICDEAKEIRQAAMEIFPSCRVQLDRTHLSRRVLEQAIRPRVLDEGTRELRKFIGFQILSLLHSPSREIFATKLSELQDISAVWMNDAVLGPLVSRFIGNSKEYATHYDFPGCPPSTNSLEGFFGYLDKRRKNYDVRSREKWARYLASLVTVHNRKMLERIREDRL